jgi:hypothetical protein
MVTVRVLQALEAGVGTRVLSDASNDVFGHCSLAFVQTFAPLFIAQQTRFPKRSVTSEPYSILKWPERWSSSFSYRHLTAQSCRALLRMQNAATVEFWAFHSVVALSDPWNQSIPRPRPLPCIKGSFDERGNKVR